MGVAYFIVLDNNQPGFDTLVGGKGLAKESDRLVGPLKSAGLRPLNDFLSYSPEEIEAMREEFGTEETPDWYKGEQWFDAKEGIEWVRSVRELIQSGKAVVKNGDLVASDLDEYETVLRQADAIGARWHLSIDY